MATAPSEPWTFTPGHTRGLDLHVQSPEDLTAQISSLSCAQYLRAKRLKPLKLGLSLRAFGEFRAF